MGRPRVHGQAATRRATRSAQCVIGIRQNVKNQQRVRGVIPKNSIDLPKMDQRGGKPAGTSGLSAGRAGRQWREPPQQCWETEGWVSLGRTRNYDWMHVQAARV